MSSSRGPVPALVTADGQLEKGARRMWGVYRLCLLASVCLLLVLAGCVPIQPEAPAASEQLPASSSQRSPQATIEATATSIPEPSDPPTTEAQDPQAPPTADTPEPPTITAPESPPSIHWQVFVDDARGLSLSYPPGWLFFDPTKKELTEFMEELDQKANNDGIRELLATSTQAIQQEDLFVGLGFQYPTGISPDTKFVNNINAIFFPTEGLFLQLIAQLIAAQLESMEGFEVDSAEVVAGLRPEGAEVASVRYRSEGALFNQPDMEVVGWQVGVLSPDGEGIVILTFSVRSEDLAELEPLLAEIVQRVRWLK